MLEKHIASILKVKEQETQGTSMQQEANSLFQWITERYITEDRIIETTAIPILVVRNPRHSFPHDEDSSTKLLKVNQYQRMECVSTLIGKVITSASQSNFLI
jgi:hypothetical protein